MDISSDELEGIIATLDPEKEYIISITDTELVLDSILETLATAENCQINLDLSACTNLTTIEENAFNNCTTLTGITLPEGVTTISANAFSGCTNLTSITISDKVTSISEEAFTGCTELTEFTVKMTAETLNLAALPNITSYNINLDVSNCTDFTSLTADTLSSYTSITGFILPIEKLSTVASALGSTTEYNIKITDIAPSLSDIKTNITGHKVSLDLSECSGITTIEADTFKNCTGLTGITLPDSVTSIGNYAFDGCNRLKKVHISNLETWMNINFENYKSNPLYNAHHLFIAGTEVTELEIPSTVTSIGNYAFDGCFGLTSVTIPDSVTSIGNYAFSDCRNLTSITFLDPTTWYTKKDPSVDDSNAIHVDVTNPRITEWITRISCFFNYYWYKTDEPAE